MLLVKSKHRLDVRSTAEMTVGELVMLKGTLESSDVVSRHVYDKRPKRGCRTFGFIPLFLLYILMECRKTTYRGIVRNLSDDDCVRLGLVGADGAPRRPSAATLNVFVNRTLAHIAEKIGDEFASAVMNVSNGCVNTMDSMPVEANRYNDDADFSVHYDVRMDKAHMLMVGGYPLFMVQSNGNDHDNPFAGPLLSNIQRVCPGYTTDEFHADGSYDAFGTYAQVYLSTGAIMRCYHRSDAVMSGVDGDMLRDTYAKMWRTKGFDPHRKNDTDFVLRFLHRNGKEELVGRYLRDRSMELSEREGRTGVRRVCETVHRAMKRWVDFRTVGLRRRTRSVRMRCRFLCVQLLSVLFRGYLDT
jgi:hypothetical protein